MLTTDMSKSLTDLMLARVEKRLRRCVPKRKSSELRKAYSDAARTIHKLRRSL